jgi:hypothetical protein
VTRSAALPFTLHRSEDVIGKKELTSTREIVHGLLRLDGERLLIQWRTSRSTDRVGQEIRTERALEPVREIELPLSALASAKVRWSWREWPPGPYLVLTAVDLRAFESVAGEGGLKLNHPAELAIRLRGEARTAVREFAGELELALADLALAAAQGPDRLTSRIDAMRNERQLPSDQG